MRKAEKSLKRGRVWIGRMVHAPVPQGENSVAELAEDTAALDARHWIPLTGPLDGVVASTRSQQHVRLVAGVCGEWHPSSDAGCSDISVARPGCPPWDAQSGWDSSVATQSIPMRTSVVDDRRPAVRRMLSDTRHRSCRGPTVKNSMVSGPKRPLSTDRTAEVRKFRHPAG